MSTAICIRRASWIVAFDAERDQHVYRRDGDVVWEAGRLVQVGGSYAGQVAEEVDGRGKLVLPGLINIHCHPAQSPLLRGYVEEFGNPRLFYSSRHRFRQSFLPDAAAQRAAARFSYCEMVLGGTTSVVDLSHPYPGWLELLAESGLRAWAAPMYRSATWYTDTGQETKYDWYPDGGAADFAAAVEVMETADRHPSGRLASMVSPAQVDTCTPELLQQSAALARRTRRPLHTHAAQSYAEFANMTRRHSMTPLEWLGQIGFLGPTTILGHAVFTDAHPWVLWPTRNDLQLLSETGTSVAHCPTVFARDGSLLHNLGSYLSAGIDVAIGTDTHPQNLLEEMRVAETLARVAAGPRHNCDTARVFTCATIGAAKVLGRNDLGRLARGARADVVLCTLDVPAMQPARDPLRTLVHSAADRAVTDVWVDGSPVVRDRRVLTLNLTEAAAEVTVAQRRTEAEANLRAGAAMDEVAPLCLPLSA